MVLPKPLVPSSTRLRASERKSKVSARSMMSRSILVGQSHSKSAIGLKLLMPEKRRRRSRLRRACSAISAWANCSNIWRGDQRALVARARKSSSSAGRARSPMSLSWSTRLGGFIGVLLGRAGEFVVGLQILRPHLDQLSLRMTAQIHRRGRRGRAGESAQQESDGGGARGMAFERLANGAAQSGGAVQIQEPEELSGLLARGFSQGEGLIQERFTFRRGLHQAAGRGDLEGLALGLQQSFLMGRMKHLVVTIIAAR